MKAPEGKYAWSAKVGEKGQIVIPKEARELFNIKSGDTLLLLGDIKRGIAIVNDEKLKHIFSDIFDENTAGDDKED